MVKTLQGVLVEPDSPEFLEDQVRYDKDVFDFTRVNVRTLRQQYREKQRHYYTSPIDPAGERIRFYPGGYTIWSGEPGSGKTTILRQLAAYYLRDNQGTFVCSLEESPVDVFMRHVCTAMGTNNPSEDAIQWCIDTWSETLKIWNYSARDSDCEHAKIFAAIGVLARDCGIRHAIIDNLFSMDVPFDLASQAQFAKKLIRTCTLSNVHLHLVAHPRKRQRSDQEHTQDDIAGIADLSRSVDNIGWVKRGKAENEVSNPDVTPMRVDIFKQRWFTGWRGNIIGWYHRKMYQFNSDEFATEPIHYLCDEAYRFRLDPEPLFQSGEYA